MPAATLKGCTIALSGTFKGHKQTDLTSLIAANGAVHSKVVTAETTHLVTTQTDVAKPSTKVTEAKSYSGIHLVSLDWLLDSIEKKKKSPENEYDLCATSVASPQKDEVKANGKKRVRSEETKEENGDSEPANVEPPSKKVKDGQRTTLKSLNIPIDEGCNLPGIQKVYIDEDGLIYDATLNQTHIQANNNKFYRLQVLEAANGSGFYTWTRWGRVGSTGQSAKLGNGDLASAIKAFESKFKDKSGLTWENRHGTPKKKDAYTFLERHYENDSDDEQDGHKKAPKKNVSGKDEHEPEPECSLPDSIQRLMSFIFNSGYFDQALAAQNYDANKMPLGKMSKRTLLKGYEVLKNLAEVLQDPLVAQAKYEKSFVQAIGDLTDQYYSIVPHASRGQRRLPILNTAQLVKKEADLLENLTDMEIANSIMKIKFPRDNDGRLIHPLQHQYNGLEMQEMTPLNKDTAEFAELENYLTKSRGTHGFVYEAQDIFRIERSGEFQRFNDSTYSKLPTSSDRRLLWHGSRSTNFGGILSQGLRIAPPEAPVSGYMFGKGIYLADVSSKSAQYCWASTSDNTGLLLLCEAELGQPMLELKQSNYDAGSVARNEGKLTTLGMGTMVPPAWKDASCVNPTLKGVKMPDPSSPISPNTAQGLSLMYNEYICYDVAQIRLRYLFRVKFL